MVEGVGFDHLRGKLSPVPGIRFLIIRGSVENPSGVFSAKDFMLRGFVTFALGNEVGGSGFMIRASGAPKFRGSWVEE